MTGPVEIAAPELSGWVQRRFGVSLTTTSSEVGLEVRDLVGLALRRNPRRAHLLVSTVLGKHLPADPTLVVAVGRLLGELVARTMHQVHSPDLSGPAVAAVRGSAPAELLGALDGARSQRGPTPVTVLGFAETATSLGQLVSDQLEARCYLHSTRRPVPDVAVAGRFEEGHSHATSHLLLPVPVGLLDDDSPLVLVDDELSTGRTAMGTIEELHRRTPRSRYVIASLIDLRSVDDERRLLDLAGRLDCRIEVVSLVRGSVVLPDGLSDDVARQLVDLPFLAAPVAHQTTEPSPEARFPWPSDVPDGGRHGFLAGDRAGFDSALQIAAEQLREVVNRRLPVESAGRRRILIVGTEEFMYLPLRLAAELAADAQWDVSFQSTTRSPVLAVDEVGYPIRRQLCFADPEGDPDIPRYLYNAAVLVDERQEDPSLVVVIADPAAATATMRGATGPLAAIRAAGVRAELVVAGGTDPARLAQERAGEVLPDPLVGPSFGSYPPEDVRWLLTDLSDVDLEGDVAEREVAIQAGTAHYAESLPVEFQPDDRYQRLFSAVLANSTSRLALAVGSVTELVLQERGHDVVLASLARAGTPIGILMRRWARYRHGLDLPHYALSIVRGRGIDTVALRYLAQHHEASQVVFVDGWTGKGAIALELSAAIEQVRTELGLDFNDDLAVLADPGHCVRTFGTRDDFLIASACLNSTVSGLVSRTVLNERYLRPGQFHGAKFYRHLADADVSMKLVDAVTEAFPRVEPDVNSGLAALSESDREPTFAGWKAIEAIREEYGIESVNFVKPGVGETTRVLLRRVPWRILVREADNPDHQHLRLLAQQRNVPVEVRPDLPYSCVGLIRRMSASEPGEN